MPRVLCVLGMYVVAFCLNTAIFAVWFSRHTFAPGQDPGYAVVAYLFAVFSGPLAWCGGLCGFLPAGAMIWLLATCVSSTLRNLRLVVHFAIGLIWMFAGLLWVMSC